MDKKIEEITGSLDEMFPELVGVKPPIHLRTYYWLIVWWANLKGRIRKATNELQREDT